MVYPNVQFPHVVEWKKAESGIQLYHSGKKGKPSFVG
jgi:hypothetical protein